jgi:sugar phosphate isomerase/epimerase
VSSVCADFFKKYGFFQNSQQVKESNIFVLRKLIEACGSIGCRVLLIPFFEETEIRNEKDKEDVIRTLDLMDKLLEKYGVDICLETTLCSDEIAEFMEKIDRPHVKVYYDIGNGAYFKYNPSEEILRLSKWIGGVHIKDRNKEGRNVMLGTGLVDFPACFKSLKKVRYKGNYILETTMCDNPIEAAKKNLEFVKTLL